MLHYGTSIVNDFLAGLFDEIYQMFKVSNLTFKVIAV